MLRLVGTEFNYESIEKQITEWVDQSKEKSRKRYLVKKELAPSAMSESDKQSSRLHDR